MEEKIDKIGLALDILQFAEELEMTLFPKRCLDENGEIEIKRDGGYNYSYHQPEIYSHHKLLTKEENDKWHELTKNHLNEDGTLKEGHFFNQDFWKTEDDFEEIICERVKENNAYLDIYRNDCIKEFTHFFFDEQSSGVYWTEKFLQETLPTGTVDEYGHKNMFTRYIIGDTPSGDVFNGRVDLWGKDKPTEEEEKIKLEDIKRTKFIFGAKKLQETVNKLDSRDKNHIYVAIQKFIDLRTALQFKKIEDRLAEKGFKPSVENSATELKDFWENQRKTIDYNEYYDCYHIAGIKEKDMLLVIDACRRVQEELYKEAKGRVIESSVAFSKFKLETGNKEGYGDDYMLSFDAQYGVDEDIAQRIIETAHLNPYHDRNIYHQSMPTNIDIQNGGWDREFNPKECGLVWVGIERDSLSDEDIEDYYYYNVNVVLRDYRTGVDFTFVDGDHIWYEAVEDLLDDIEKVEKTADYKENIEYIKGWEDLFEYDEENDEYIKVANMETIKKDIPNKENGLLKE